MIVIGWTVLYGLNDDGSRQDQYHRHARSKNTRPHGAQPPERGRSYTCVESHVGRGSMIAGSRGSCTRDRALVRPLEDAIPAVTPLPVRRSIDRLPLAYLES